MSPIIARDTKRNFTPAPEGFHNGTCVDVVDRGLQKSDRGPAHRVELRWQIEALNPDSQERFVVSEWYRLSLHEMAKLRHHLEGWRGKKFTQEEVDDGVALDELIGVGCQLQVVHKVGKDGRTFANVQAILPLSKGMRRLEPESYTRVEDRVDGFAMSTDEVKEKDQNDNAETFPF